MAGPRRPGVRAALLLRRHGRHPHREPAIRRGNALGVVDEPAPQPAARRIGQPARHRNLSEQPRRRARQQHPPRGAPDPNAALEPAVQQALARAGIQPQRQRQPHGKPRHRALRHGAARGQPAPQSPLASRRPRKKGGTAIGLVSPHLLRRQRPPAQHAAGHTCRHHEPHQRRGRPRSFDAAAPRRLAQPELGPVATLARRRPAQLRGPLRESRQHPGQRRGHPVANRLRHVHAPGLAGDGGAARRQTGHRRQLPGDPGRHRGDPGSGRASLFGGGRAAASPCG